MEFDTLSVDIDGVSSVVKAIGKGPAVIALHGAATLEGHQWARALADRFRVYLPLRWSMPMSSGRRGKLRPSA
jgi:hypothetical protein